MASEHWIANRTLTVSGTACVEIRIGAPVRVGDAFRCAVEVVGLEKHGLSSWAYGADSIQAIMLALQMAGDTLYASDEAVRGLLRWGVLQNLGLPVSEALAERVPTDES